MLFQQLSRRATMFDRTCGTCDKNFKSQRKDGNTCFGCALERITNGQPPEEGDFNTALIVSGEMSDRNARQLQEELEAIDHCGAAESYEEDLVYHDDQYEDWQERDEND